MRRVEGKLRGGSEKEEGRTRGLVQTVGVDTEFAIMVRMLVESEILMGS